MSLFKKIAAYFQNHQSVQIDKYLKRTRVSDEQSAVRNAIWSALQRNPTYVHNVSDKDKEALRARTAQLLREFSRQYNSPVDDAVHVQNIRSISDLLSCEFTAILQGGRFRIGTSQKALNLYLKFLWCLQLIPLPPPHCPIDATILQKARIDGAWTQLDSCSVYMDYIIRLREFAGASKYGDLQQWELTLWNQ